MNNQAEVLKDWGAITARLLQDSGDNVSGGSKRAVASTRALSEERVLILARIFCKSAQLFCGDGESLFVEAGRKRGAKRRKVFSQSSDESEELATSLSTHLVKTLPELLEKFQAEPGILKRLVPLTGRLLPHVISVGQHKAAFKRLLKQLKHLLLHGDHGSGILSGTAGEEVSVAVCASLRELNEMDHSRKSDVEAMLHEISEELEKKVAELIDSTALVSSGKKRKKGSKNTNESNLADSEYALSNALGKLALLSKSIDLAPFIDLDDLLESLETAIEQRTAQEAVLRHDKAVSRPRVY